MHTSGGSVFAPIRSLLLMQGQQRAREVERTGDRISHGLCEAGVTPEEIAEWFQTWRSDLRQFFASRRLPWPDVEDLTQEVFFGLLRSPPSYRVDNPRLYVFTAAKNVFSDWWTKTARRRRCWEAMPQEPEAMSESAERELVKNDELSEIRRHVQRLPERQSRLVTLHMDNQLTYLELAQALGITHRMVMRDLLKAYDALRGSLRDVRSTN